MLIYVYSYDMLMYVCTYDMLMYVYVDMMPSCMHHIKGGLHICMTCSLMCVDMMLFM